MKRVLLAAVFALAAPSISQAQTADILLLLQGQKPGQDQGPTQGPSRSIGSAANGCLAGGKSLPLSGPGWEVLRPERNRFWGNQALVDFIKDMAGRAKDEGIGTLLVADMAQPRGGKMPSGHGSHQTGVDVDILYRLTHGALSKAERDNPNLDSVLQKTGLPDPKMWGVPQERLVRLFASDSRVERIFVNPQIKVALCKSARGNRSWLRRVRPWWGHDEHFHVRLACPVGDMDCLSGTPLPEGDGCGTEVQSWITSNAWEGKPSSNSDESREAATPPLACKDILGRK